MTTDKIKIEHKLNKQINIKLLCYLQQRARWKVKVNTCADLNFKLKCISFMVINLFNMYRI